MLIDTAPSLELQHPIYFFLQRELLILSVWSQGPEELEAQVTEHKPISLFHAGQASILQMAQQKALHNFGGCPVF